MRTDASNPNWGRRTETETSGMTTSVAYVAEDDAGDEALKGGDVGRLVIGELEQQEACPDVALAVGEHAVSDGLDEGKKR
jgi:hypothetical protein